MKSINPQNIDNIRNSYEGKASNQIMPNIYIIEPTNNCNYSCSICPNRLYSKSEKGFMSLELFSKIISQIAEYADLIQLFWIGEPLLHNDLCEMVRQAKIHTKAKVSISTNGSYLSEEIVAQLVNSGLDDLIISLDGAESNEIYGQIRRNGKLDSVKKNVKSILRYSSSISITIKFILTNINKCEMQQFIEQWKDYGVKIKIQCLYTWANQLPELNTFSDYLSPQLQNKRVACSDLWYKIAIHWNGKVSICCFDWSFKNVFGDLTEDTIENVWNCSFINQLRESHLKETYTLICKKCDAWAEPIEYEELL